MNRSGIYQIVNTENGKRYVGSAKCFHVRKAKHFSSLSLGKHHARHLQAAFKKYGADAFSLEVLLVCAAGDLLFYEQRAIDALKPEYNSSPTAGNTLGVKCSPERKKKISEALTGRKLSAVQRRNIALGALGRRPSPETRIKLKIASQRRAADPEWRRKVSDGKTGIPLTKEHREALRHAKTGVPANLTEEVRLAKNRKIGEANRVRPISDSMRKNMSVAARNSKSIERFTFRGQQRTVLSLAEEFGVDRHVLRKRLNAGWTIERAVTQPTKILRKHDRR